MFTAGTLRSQNAAAARGVLGLFCVWFLFKLSQVTVVGKSKQPSPSTQHPVTVAATKGNAGSQIGHGNSFLEIDIKSNSQRLAYISFVKWFKT